VGAQVEHAEREAEHAEYPWRSPCGPELNFIKAADPHAALVFQQLVRRSGGHAGEGTGDAGDAVVAGDGSRSGGGDGRWALTYGSPSAETLWVPFDPASLCVSAGTGRLFHGAAGTRCCGGGGVGLVKSHLALELSERIVPMTEQEQRQAAAEAAGLAEPSEERGAMFEAAEPVAVSGFCFEWPDEGSGGGVGRWPIYLLP
jgi:hypothetical protein